MSAPIYLRREPRTINPNPEHKVSTRIYNEGRTEAKIRGATAIAKQMKIGRATV